MQLTAHTVDTNMLYSILHSKRNECEIENNNLAGFTHINTGERYTLDWFSGSLSRRTVFVARRGAGDWIKEAAADVTIS